MRHRGFHSCLKVYHLESGIRFSNILNMFWEQRTISLDQEWKYCGFQISAVRVENEDDLTLSPGCQELAAIKEEKTDVVTSLSG